MKSWLTNLNPAKFREYRSLSSLKTGVFQREQIWKNHFGVWEGSIKPYVLRVP